MRSLIPKILAIENLAANSKFTVVARLRIGGDFKKGKYVYFDLKLEYHHLKHFGEITI